MLGLAFVAVGSFCKRSFASASIRSPFRLFLPLRQCPFLMQGLLRNSCTPGLPLLLPPSLRKGGMMGGGSRDALVLLPEGFPLPLDFCPARGVEEPLDARLVHASSLLSPRFIRGLGRQELLSSATRSVPVGSPSSSLHALRDDGAGESSGAFSVLACLSRLISARSARWWDGRVFRVPLRWIPPWLPDLRLGKPGRCFEPAHGDGSRGRSCCSRFPCSVERSWRCGRGSSRLLFSLAQSQCVCWRSLDR